MLSIATPERPSPFSPRASICALTLVNKAIVALPGGRLEGAVSLNALTIPANCQLSTDLCDRVSHGSTFGGVSMTNPFREPLPRVAETYFGRPACPVAWG